MPTGARSQSTRGPSHARRSVVARRRVDERLCPQRELRNLHAGCPDGERPGHLHLRLRPARRPAATATGLRRERHRHGHRRAPTPRVRGAVHRRPGRGRPIRPLLRPDHRELSPRVLVGAVVLQRQRRLRVLESRVLHLGDVLGSSHTPRPLLELGVSTRPVQLGRRILRGRLVLGRRRALRLPRVRPTRLAPSSSPSCVLAHAPLRPSSGARWGSEPWRCGRGAGTPPRAFSRSPGTRRRAAAGGTFRPRCSAARPLRCPCARADAQHSGWGPECPLA